MTTLRPTGPAVRSGPQHREQDWSALSSWSRGSSAYSRRPPLRMQPQTLMARPLWGMPSPHLAVLTNHSANHTTRRLCCIGTLAWNNQHTLMWLRAAKEGAHLLLSAAARQPRPTLHFQQDGSSVSAQAAGPSSMFCSRPLVGVVLVAFPRP